MAPLPILAHAEPGLPGRTWAQRLEHARRLDLALEVAHRRGEELAPLLRARARVVTLVAWDLHEAHALHADPARRRAGADLLAEAIELAARHGVPRVLAVCGFGHAVCERPFERCVEFFGTAVVLARRHGVQLLLEPLGSNRAGAMTERDEIERLLDAVDAPDALALCLDFGHLQDAGHDPAAWIRGLRHRVEEVQLRGPGSRAPAAGAELERWLAALPAPPAVATIEHHERLDAPALDALVPRLRASLGRVFG